MEGQGQPETRTTLEDAAKAAFDEEEEEKDRKRNEFLTVCTEKGIRSSDLLSCSALEELKLLAIPMPREVNLLRLWKWIQRNSAPTADKKRKRLSNKGDRAFEAELKKLRPDIELGSLGSGEGINMDNPIKTLREETCKKIFESIARDKAVLVKAPPYSGKTSLATVFGDFCNRARLHVVFVSFLGWRMKRKESGLDVPVDGWFYDQVGIESVVELTEEAWRNTIIIIDEAQVLYSLDKDHPIWALVKDSMMQDKNGSLYLLFLAAYGERGFYHEQHTDFHPTPVAFSSVFDITTLRYTQGEYEELLTAYNGKTQGDHFQFISDGISQVIWTATLGHPGLVREALLRINEKTKSTRRASTSKEIKDPDILAFLLSGSFLSYVAGSRAALQKAELKAEECHLLKEVILRRVAAARPPTPELMTLTTRGVLAILDDDSVEFAAPILRSVYIQAFFRSTAPGHLVANLNDFVVLCLGALNTASFITSFSRHAEGEPVYEALWQNEFYKAATTVLGPTYDVSPEIGVFFGSGGKLDFYIDSKKQWGIELLREGDRLKQHVERFSAGGEYAEIVLKEHAVIDFCKATKRKPIVNHANLWVVAYASDFKAGIVYCQGKPPCPVTFLGGDVLG